MGKVAFTTSNEKHDDRCFISYDNGPYTTRLRRQQLANPFNTIQTAVLSLDRHEWLVWPESKSQPAPPR
jgi:hypothetical protein